MRNVTILLAVVAMLALAGTAWGDSVWNSGSGGGDGSSWSDAGNWTGGVPNGNLVRIDDGGTAVINAATNTIDDLYMGSATSNVGHLIIQGDGTLTVASYGSIGDDNPDAASHATVTQTGGTVSFNNLLMVGSNMFTDGSGKGKYTISGGSLNVAVVLYLGLGESGVASEGIFRVEGSNPAITVAAWYQNYGGNSHDAILQCAVDSTSGISVIAVTGAATFEPYSILDMDFLGATKPDTWDLLTAGSTSNEGNLVLKDEDKLSGGVGWTIAWRDKAGGGRILSATYVPEPATMALLGLGGLGVLLRRRKR